MIAPNTPVCAVGEKNEEAPVAIYQNLSTCRVEYRNLSIAISFIIYRSSVAYRCGSKVEFICYNFIIKLIYSSRARPSRSSRFISWCDMEVGLYLVWNPIWKQSRGERWHGTRTDWTQCLMARFGYRIIRLMRSLGQSTEPIKAENCCRYYDICHYIFFSLNSQSVSQSVCDVW